MVGTSMQKLKSLLEDIESFLKEIQRKENLSPWAVKERTKVLNALQDFRKENSELLVEDNCQSNSVGPDDELYDDTCVTTGTMGSVSTEGLDDIYEDTDMPDTTSLARSQTESVGETLSKQEDGDSDSKSIAVKDIENPQMSGYMEKKKKSDSKLTSKLFGGGFKNHYLVLKDGVLYFYKKETDKAQKETLNIEGYDIRPIPGLNKDKAEKSIQLFCPAKATYELLAPSKDECKKWTGALEAVLGKITLDSVSTTEGTGDIDDIDGEIYDEADMIGKDVRLTPMAPDEETYDDTTIQSDLPPQPDWGKLPPPPDDFYEDTELAKPPRPSKVLLVHQKSSLHGAPNSPGPVETYDDTFAPPAIAEELYDDSALPIEEEIYDDASVPPPPTHPPPKLPPAVKSQMQSRPPAQVPTEEEIYDDTDAPPPPPVAKLPQPARPVQSRPPAQVPIAEEIYDDTDVPPPPPVAKLPQPARPVQSRPPAQVPIAEDIRRHRCTPTTSSGEVATTCQTCAISSPCSGANCGGDIRRHRCTPTTSSGEVATTCQTCAISSPC
ncbi:uncharacterized protein LOC135498280 [Lineus longissimus]|uniref:uncharacterized protein LOC135498280 n=1 Tax=Lineus longissimus TaxID=88925 RepID=UPI00315C7CE3